MLRRNFFFLPQGFTFLDFWKVLLTFFLIKMLVCLRVLSNVLRTKLLIDVYSKRVTFGGSLRYIWISPRSSFGSFEFLRVNLRFFSKTSHHFACFKFFAWSLCIKNLAFLLVPFLQKISLFLENFRNFWIILLRSFLKQLMLLIFQGSDFFAS